MFVLQVKEPGDAGWTDIYRSDSPARLWGKCTIFSEQFHHDAEFRVEPLPNPVYPQR